jgi:hypothetical protein
MKRRFHRDYGDALGSETAGVGAVGAGDNGKPAADGVDDRFAGLSQRFAQGLKLIEGGAKSHANGHEPSEAALNAASAEWYKNQRSSRRDDGAGKSNGHANGHANGHGNGHANGEKKKKPHCAALLSSEVGPSVA